MASQKFLQLFLGIAVAAPANAQLLPRSAPVAGRIVATKGGEQARLLPETRFRNAVPRQDLKPGDTLRTNATGTLAVIFADRTQVRLGRNTILVVKEVTNGSPSSVRLESGTFWGRAVRGQGRLSVETPSATAAIRGTDWSLAVTPTQTDLQVFDGAIDFFNDQGRLSVVSGQAARARLGEAPARIVTVQSTEREQMQYYFPADGIYEFLSPNILSGRVARAERARVLAVSSEARGAEDWLLLAETGMLAQPRTERFEAIRRLEAMRLTQPQQARLLLLQAWRAAQERDYASARDLFDRSLPGLDPDRAIAARYGRYVAAVRADPSLATRLDPPATEPARLGSWLGQSFLAAYAGDYSAARIAAEQVSLRFPDRPEGPVISAAIAMLLDDRQALDAATAEALRRDPDDPDALMMRGNLEMTFNNRSAEAERLYARALAFAPSGSTLLSNFAQTKSQRGATRAAEKAFRRAIAENPKDPLLRINHAIVLMDENRLAESKREIDAALAIDPTLATAQVVRARHTLQMGDAEAALPDALAGSAADPGGADSLLVLALLYYRRGDYDAALQQIDAADRLDPAGPGAPLIRAAVALDRMDIDSAISAAREAQRRSVARGGDYLNPSQSSSTGGYIASSFRAIGLDDWGRFYGDRLFEPFTSTGYFDRIASGTSSPFLIDQKLDAFDPEHAGTPDASSNLMQGLSIEPLAIASPTRYLQLLHEQFVEVSFGAGLFANGDDVSVNPTAGFQALRLDPLPIAVNVNASLGHHRGPQGTQDDRRDILATALLSAEITPYDKIALFGSLGDSRFDLPGESNAPRLDGLLDTNAKQLLAVYSHEFGRKSVLTLGGAVSRASVRIQRSDLFTFDPTPADPTDPNLPAVVATDIRQGARSSTFTISYAANLGIFDINVGAGFPAQRLRRLDQSVLLLAGVPITIPDVTSHSHSSGERYHLDVRVVPSTGFALQGQVASTDSVDGRVIDWRIGGAVQVAPNHWLRAGWFRETRFGSAFTLAPTRAVGLIPNEAPVPEGFRSKTLAVRWDGEWTPHLFTAIEYQRQRFDALSFSLPQFVASPFVSHIPNCDLGLCSLTYFNPDVDRFTASANAWIRGGFGLAANYARTWSHMPGGGADDDVPFLPRHSARVGLVWQDPARVTARLSATYTGSRRSDLLDTRLDDFVSADLGIEWEALDRRLLVSAAVSNLLDKKYHIVSGVPGFGRTANLSATFRF